MNRKVDREKGNTLELEWKFNGIPENDVIDNVRLYFNVTKPDSQAVISIWDVSAKSPTVSSTGRRLFGSRILVSFISNIYKLTIIKSQYNDTGPYLLEAAVGPPGISGNTIKNSIINAEIKGKSKFRNFYFLFVRI